MQAQKPFYQSTTWWVNFLTALVFFLTPMPLATTIVGSLLIYTCNLILNKVANNTPIVGPSVDLTGFGITMKGLIYFVNVCGILVDVYQALLLKLGEQGVEYHPAAWVTYTVATLTALMRLFTTQPKRIGS